jgi:hypothetical protein
MASDLSRQLEELDFDPGAADARTLANLWTSSNDARGYAVIGDPAVRLPLGDAAHAGARPRESIDVPAVARPAAPTAAAPATPEPQGFAARIIGALDKAVEVRTYVSADARAAAALDRATLAREGDLRAFTRVEPDGSMDVIVQPRDAAADPALWNLHLELVKQAQAARVETIKAVLASTSRPGAESAADAADVGPAPRTPES